MPYLPQGYLLNGYDASHFADNSLSNVADTTVLDKLKNVDGTGSGLDADLLEGFHASQTPVASQIPVLNSSGQLQLPFHQTPVLVNGQDLMYRTFYVDAVNGNDANNGSSSVPFQTIKKAVDSIPIGGYGVIYLKEGQTFDINNSIINIINKSIKLEKWGTGTANPKLSFHPRANGHWGFFLANSFLWASNIDMELLPATDTTSVKYIGAFQLVFSSVHFYRCNISLDPTYLSYLTISDGWWGSFSAVNFYVSTITTSSKGYVLLLKEGASASLGNNYSTIDNASYWVSGIVRDTNGIPRNIISNIIL